MDAMVSGRVPVQVKEHGARILAEIGATQSQLIQAAYEYLIAEGKLPAPAEKLRGGGALKEQDIKDLEDFINKTTVKVDPSFWEGFDLKEELARGRAADYEALA
ncbi:MAG: hypothetical protein Q4E12_00150 [Coriobacteriia bacterium]|nr:hypothetical protein [Coriobacteriia bacterium]